MMVLDSQRRLILYILKLSGLNLSKDWYGKLMERLNWTGHLEPLIPSDFRYKYHSKIYQVSVEVFYQIRVSQ